MSSSIWDPDQEFTDTVNSDGTLRSQRFIATAGQVLFTLTEFAYQIGTNSLLVEINGVDQFLDVDYEETSNTEVTLLEACLADDVVVIRGFVGITGAQDAAISAAVAECAAAVAVESLAIIETLVSAMPGFPLSGELGGTNVSNTAGSLTFEGDIEFVGTGTITLNIPSSANLQFPVGTATIACLTENIFTGAQTLHSGAFNECLHSAHVSSGILDIWSDGLGNVITLNETAQCSAIGPNPVQAGMRRKIVCLTDKKFVATTSLLIAGFSAGAVYSAVQYDTIDAIAITTAITLLNPIKYDGGPLNQNEFILGIQAIPASSTDVLVQIPSGYAEVDLKVRDLYVSCSNDTLVYLQANAETDRIYDTLTIGYRVVNVTAASAPTTTLADYIIASTSINLDRNNQIGTAVGEGINYDITLFAATSNITKKVKSVSDGAPIKYTFSSGSAFVTTAEYLQNSETLSYIRATAHITALHLQCYTGAGYKFMGGTITLVGRKV